MVRGILLFFALVGVLLAGKDEEFTGEFTFEHSGGVYTYFDSSGPITRANKNDKLQKVKTARRASNEWAAANNGNFPDPEFYGQFMCPKGPWIKHYGWTEKDMEKKAELLGKWQLAMESCPGYERPGIRRYVNRHWAYEDPEWVKPKCQEYDADAHNVDYQCVKRNVRRNQEHNITSHDDCGRRFKCWPQLMITHQGKMIFRPSYKAGSQSMRDHMRCQFKDFGKEIWPCDNIYPNSRYTLSDEEQTYKVLHMIRHPVPRFASALIEQYTRWCDPPEKEKYRLGLTKWWPLAERNASTYQLMEAFLRDTECHIDHPWWPHSATGLWHMTEYEYPNTKFDGTNPVPPIDYIFKLERFESDWTTALQEMNIKQKKCQMPDINRHDDAQHVGPPKEDLLDYLADNEQWMRRVCAIYYADFICFDYKIPEVCEDMLNPRPGVCPL